MNILQRMLFTFVLATGIVFVVRIFNMDLKDQATLIFIVLLSGLVLPMVSLYSNQTFVVVHDQTGNPVPKYLESTRKRDQTGKIFTIIAIAGILLNLIFGIIFPELSYEIDKNYEKELVIPFIIALFIGAYFSFTNQCPYCCKFNVPKDSNCVECGNPLYSTWMNKYAKQREIQRKNKKICSDN